MDANARRRGLRAVACSRGACAALIAGLALAACLPSRAQDAAVPAPGSAATPAPAVASEAGLLARGRMGRLRIGMSRQAVEALLQHPIPDDVFALEPPVVTFSQAADLQALGLDRFGGFPAIDAYLGFESGAEGDVLLRAISIDLACDSLPQLATRLGGWEGEDGGHAYAWFLRRAPSCHVTLWRPPPAD